MILYPAVLAQLYLYACMFAHSLELPARIHREGRAPSECLCVYVDSAVDGAACTALAARGAPALKYITQAADNEASRTGAAVALQNPRRYQLAAWRDLGFAERLWRKLLAGGGGAAVVAWAAARGLGAPAGLNERLRLLRYRPGDRFESHFDREVPTDDGRHRSLVTVLLYLNDAADFEGGATLFEDTTEKSAAAVAPACGRVVLFEHGLWHSGAPVAAGTKLVLRTDVLFDAAATKPPPAPVPTHAKARGVWGLADAVAPDLSAALEAIGLLDCGVEALLSPGRAVYAAMLGNSPGADRLWAAAVAEADALPVAPANTRAAVTSCVSCEGTREVCRGELIIQGTRSGGGNKGMRDSPNFRGLLVRPCGCGTTP